jgi:hypothetical protein
MRLGPSAVLHAIVDRFDVQTLYERKKRTRCTISHQRSTLILRHSGDSNPHTDDSGTLFAFVKVGVTTRHAVACLDAPLLVPIIPELENGQWLS